MNCLGQELVALFSLCHTSFWPDQCHELPVARVSPALGQIKLCQSGSRYSSRTVASVASKKKAVLCYPGVISKSITLVGLGVC